MKVKEVIRKAAIFLCKSDLANAVKNSSSGFEDDINELLEYYNYAENEITTKFFPIKKVEKVNSTNGNIAYAKLTSTPLYIDRITDSDGRKLKFNAYSSYVETSGEGELTLTYYVSPSEKDLTDECERIMGVPVIVFIAGIAKCYYLSRGMTTESSEWGDIYYDLLRSMTVKKEVRAVMPSRKWR